jgi:hypothetical protein
MTIKRLKKINVWDTKKQTNKQTKTPGLPRNLLQELDPGL